MIAFPCHGERLAASALLLLSSNCNDSPLCFDDDDDDEGTDDDYSLFTNFKAQSFVSCESKARSLSVVTSDDDSSEQIKKRRLKINGAATRFHQMKFQVVRKSRTKQYRISDCRDLTMYKRTASMSSLSTRNEISSTTETSSCLSSSSSAISSARSRYMTAVRREEMKKHAFSPHIRRRADAILQFLSRGYASEMRIRMVLGDSPDTSKALRMLLKGAEINRSGAGGRSDPFIYMESTSLVKLRSCCALLVDTHKKYRDVYQMGTRESLTTPWRNQLPRCA